MFDITDKENGKSSLGADEFNSLRREISNIVASTGAAFDENSVVQLTQAIAAYVASGNFFADSGSANAYVLGSIGSKQAPAAYHNGMLVRFRASNANTGASTINVAGLGTKSVKKADGVTALDANTITTSFDVMLRYDSAYDCFVVASTKPSGEGVEQPFDNSSLDAGILTVTHNLGKKYVTVQVYDNNDEEVIPGTVALINTSTLMVDLTSFAPLTGTWHAVVK